MAFGNYIKVRIKTGEVAVVKTSLLPFYASQGATITEPTEDEIAQAYPEEAQAKEQSIRESILKQIEVLRQEVATLKAENDALRLKLEQANKAKKKATQTKNN